MRLKIQFELQRESLLPFNYQYALGSKVYDWLRTSSPEYADFLHTEGYHAEHDALRRFKMFTFSDLIIPKARRRIEGAYLRVQPGPIEWILSSPVNDFLQHGATGILSAGQTIEICHAVLTMREVSALPEPRFVSLMRFSCRTSIVAGIPGPGATPYYFRPSDGARFSEALRANLLHKYRVLNNGREPADDSFCLTFDANYLANPAHRGGTKKITIKQGIDVIGAFCPFTVSGSTELIQLGYQAGFGEKTSMGFGMVEIRQ